MSNIIITEDEDFIVTRRDLQGEETDVLRISGDTGDLTGKNGAPIGGGAAATVMTLTSVDSLITYTPVGSGPVVAIVEPDSSGSGEIDLTDGPPDTEHLVTFLILTAVPGTLTSIASFANNNLGWTVVRLKSEIIDVGCSATFRWIGNKWLFVSAFKAFEVIMPRDSGLVIEQATDGATAITQLNALLILLFSRGII